MDIDLRRVPIRKIEFDGIVEIPKENYMTTDVKDIQNVHLHFSIFQNTNHEDVISLEAKGSFLLEDARTLELVDDPFEINFESVLNEESEICGRFLANSQNTLDIMEILWENIVLEIPISFTVSDELDFSNESSEILEKDIDPRMAPLMDLLDKEKE